MASQTHMQADEEGMKLTSFQANFHSGADEDDGAEKHDGGRGGLLRPFRICHLAILSTAFWTFVLFLHSGTQGGAGGAASLLFKQSAFSLPPLLSGNAVGRGWTAPAAAQPPPPSALAVQAQSPPSSVPAAQHEDRSVPAPADRCAGRYIYMYDLPARFNDDIIRDCKKLWRFQDMCPHVTNSGMGRPLGDEDGVFSPRGWYATNQFTLDLIFHARMKAGYECLTDDPSLAAAIYVPFYASLDGGRHMYNSTRLRDMLALDLVEWLTQRPEWRAMGGRDHFMSAGRTTWDFRRNTDGVDEHWGTKLLNLPAVQNMTALVLEASPWSRANLAVPYPTYFHPERAAEVAAWQEKVRKAERTWLFSFAGASHPWQTETIRPQIFEQCGASSRCMLFRCTAGSSVNCKAAGAVMRVFESSIFCLQPRGDTHTRRSTFDSILAGCIPVFFHPGSAYRQYTLHLPKEPSSYSVLIMHTDVTERNVSIEETLSKIPPEKVKAMREEVIQLIPRIVYADPRSRRVDFKDAFDITMEAIIDRVAKRRRGDGDGR